MKPPATSEEPTTNTAQDAPAEPNSQQLGFVLQQDSVASREPVEEISPPGGVRTLEAIKASRQLPEMPSGTLPEIIAVPSIKGKITEQLKRAAKRVDPNDEPLSFRDEGGNVVLRTGDERGAVALACLILENLRRLGGSNVPSDALGDVLDRLLRTLTQREVMDIEVEAYEILLWLGRAIDPEIASDEERTREGTDTEIPYDPEETFVDLLRRAIREGFDLDMSYYTGGRAEMTQRRITPRSLEAETYLHAFCHRRQDDRVFRISRIGGLRPVRGRAVPGLAKRAPEEEDETPSTQLDLLPSGQPGQDSAANG